MHLVPKSVESIASRDPWTRKFLMSERARRHMCVAQTYLSAKRMTTIGMETGIQQQQQQQQHEYLSRLIYIFLLQIFTDKMTRDRIEAGPQPSAMETSSREESRGRKRGEGEGERAEGRGSAAKMLDAPCRDSRHRGDAREIRRRENIPCHCEEEFQTTRKVCTPQRGSLVETIR